MGCRTRVLRLLACSGSRPTVGCYDLPHRTRRTTAFNNLSFAAWYGKQIVESPPTRCVRVIISLHCPSYSCLSPIGVWLHPFRIYKVQSDGDLHFVEAIQTFDRAKGRVRELGEVWPGEYVIDNEETGERIFVSTRDETKN